MAEKRFVPPVSKHSQAHAGGLRLLIVEDSEVDCQLLTETLEFSGYRVIHERVDNALTMRAALGRSWDFVISDHGLPGFDSLQALDLVNELSPGTPFITVSGDIDEALALEGMRRGSVDYVFKNQLYRLVAVIERELRNRSRNTHDVLTGLLNRYGFRDLIDRYVADPGADANVALIMLDIDRFRTINEGLGYARADDLLKLVANRLHGQFDDSMIARLGSDEFALLLKGVATCDEAERRAQEICALFREPFVVGGQPLRITVSAGVSLFYQDVPSICTLFTNAERAMFYAKNRGGDGLYCFQPEMINSALEAIQIEHELHNALARDQLYVVYQPQFDVRAGRLVGVEALLRWQHPDLGLVPPAHFIPVAESSGLIVDIGRWVLNQACQQAAQWRRIGLGGIRVAVNLSARQFRDQSVVEDVRQALLDADLPPDLLEIEITEGTLMESTLNSAEVLSSLRGLGVHISVDDFGTGYSSLAYLKRFPLDALKIDRSFVADLLENDDGFAIVNAVIGLAHSLGLRTVAEGVEHQAQLDRLKMLGCDDVQGYLLGRPVQPHELAEQIRRLCA